ncbi:3-deoxy-7-phosphoheptulonate synthase [Christensenellaceae bacterium OttesenSCG-928-M15]|nr:3-deoxy-7-phosphoheptulonate synthase [Christensenellaceae bacterium OttesenSCG-928-M15]
MIVIVKRDCEQEQLKRLIAWLEGFSLQVHITEGFSQTVLGLVGDTSRVDIGLVHSMEIVEGVKRIQEPYKSANRKFHPDNTVININNATVGDGKLTLIAGPCSVESEEQIVSIARSVKRSGATMLRGGAFKPRTSPYSFQGLGADGIELLLLAKRETGLPVVTEIMDVTHLPLFENVDVIQVGARNMQNFALLSELGRIKKPILLKRGLSNTLEELLMSAEYIMAGGNEEIILCERGIRTFETATRNTLDLSAIPMLKQLSHLPIIIDPSHATGISSLVRPMSLAAVAAGADGLIIEVHNDPPHALCDGAQSLTPEAFDGVAYAVRLVEDAVRLGKSTKPQWQRA